MTTLTLRIDGMTCGHCVAAVREALGAVPGVTRVGEVNLERGLATVDGTPAPEALLASLRDAGYGASIVDGK